MTGRVLAGTPVSRAEPALDPVTVHRATHALLSAAPGASAIAVGLHREGRRALVVRGRTAHHGGVPADVDTRFEIGSLTKTFTALLLAERAARGELDHNDALARHLPAALHLPARGSRIALVHLATHTSGLPPTPPGLPHLLPLLLRSALPRLLTAPYADFTTDDLLHALTRTRLRSAPGTRMRYSNFGAALLGHALTGAAGVASYSALLDSRVLRPLRLHDTSCAAAPPPHATQVTGHRRRRPQPPLHMPAMAPAGALRSSARDLLSLTEALLDPASAGAPPALRTALVDVLRPRLRMPRGNGLALVWNFRPRPDGSVLYHHSGGTFGCTTFAGFNPEHRTALVALANTASGTGIPLIQQSYNALLGLQR